MTDRNDRENRLLAEVFHPDWLSGEAGSFAARAAARARRHRRRRVALVGSTAAILALAAFLLRLPSSSTPSPSIVARVAPPTTAPKPATPDRGYEIISDDELLAALRNRPVLVVTQTDGSREIVLLPNE